MKEETRINPSTISDLNKILDMCSKEYVAQLPNGIIINYKGTREDTSYGKREVFTITRKVD